MLVGGSVAASRIRLSRLSRLSEVSVLLVGEGVSVYDYDRSRTVHSGQAQRLPYESSLAAGGRQAFAVRGSTRPERTRRRSTSSRRASDGLTHRGFGPVRRAPWGALAGRMIAFGTRSPTSGQSHRRFGSLPALVLPARPSQFDRG